MKNQIISQIKTIIALYGYFGTADVEAEYSPVIKTKGNLIHLIDYFYLDYVEIEVYVSGDNNVIDEYDLPYEELEKETLTYILELAEKWKLICISE